MEYISFSHCYLKLLLFILLPSFSRFLSLALVVNFFVLSNEMTTSCGLLGCHFHIITLFRNQTSPPKQPPMTTTVIDSQCNTPSTSTIVTHSIAPLPPRNATPSPLPLICITQPPPPSNKSCSTTHPNTTNRSTQFLLLVSFYQKIEVVRIDFLKLIEGFFSLL